MPRAEKREKQSDPVAVSETETSDDETDYIAVINITVGASNDLQMEQNLTGGLPVLYQGHSANLSPFRESLTPAHENKV